jgi:hypothetical protein
MTITLADGSKGWASEAYRIRFSFLGREMNGYFMLAEDSADNILGTNVTGPEQIAFDPATNHFWIGNDATKVHMAVAKATDAKDNMEDHIEDLRLTDKGWGYAQVCLNRQTTIEPMASHMVACRIFKEDGTPIGPNTDCLAILDGNPVAL